MPTGQGGPRPEEPEERARAVPDPNAPAPPRTRGGHREPGALGGGGERAGDQRGGDERDADRVAEEEFAHAEALNELQDRWRQALADLDNLRKRHARELERVRADERARVAGAWLTVVDNLDRALEHGGTDPDALLAGVRAVRDQAVDVLYRLGYPRRDETGVPFDPAKHEVAAVVEDPKAPPGTVVDVLRPGYGEAGGQLRPMTVTVST
jgi:molecular chaperone GrpE